MNIRNIGILAHVDAGKTTVTEQLLYLCGGITRAGSVDSGTAHTDTLPVERARGISVKAAAASGVYADTVVTIVDTPGHADFSAEVERSLWAIDGAVVVVSAVEGVQAQTEVYYSALRAAGIPVLFFINKIDRIGADPQRTFSQLRQILGAPALAMWEEQARIEGICESEDALLEQYLDGNIPHAQVLDETARKATAAHRLCPVLCGTALRAQGIDALMQAILAYLPAPHIVPQDALCGVVFAVTHDKSMGRGMHVRLFSGHLQNRIAIGEQKITQIRVLRGIRIEDRGALDAGEIGILYGLSSIRTGDVLGDASLLPHGRMTHKLAQPLLRARVTPNDATELRALKAALEELSIEDPQLDAQWSTFTQELYVNLMGGIQNEILTSLILDRFGIACIFASPTVIYKETIARQAEGFVAYTMPKPCWAVMNFMLTPLPRGSGVHYHCTTAPTAIKPRYLGQVEQSIPRVLAQGMLGWEVTDVDIELFDGNDHQWHTHPLDFALATPMGIMDGLQRAGTVLLEPILHCRFVLPATSISKLLGDLSAMRARFDAPTLLGEMMTLTAFVPLAESMNYSVRLAAITGGRGAMTAQLHAYEPCPADVQVSCPRRSVHPLDTAKYILAARSALEGGVWD